MMALFRRFAKSWVAAVLMGVLIVSFGIWGVNDVFHNRISDAVVKAGSREVSRNEFKILFDRQLKQLQEQNPGQTITAREAVAHGFDKALLQQLATNEALLELIRREGLQPSDKLVISELRKTPAFFNPVSGAFDQRTYETLLSQNNLSPPEYEKGLRDEVAMSHFTSGVVVGLRVPRTYAALIVGYTLQNRGADYFVLGPNAVPAPKPPTDAQLLQFMKDNADRMRRPESRSINMVRFSAANLAVTMPADPAEVQKRFDFEKARLATPEKRSFIQVPVKDAAQAAAVAQRLSAGQDPAAVAKSIGAKPIVYTEAAKNTVADPRVGDAVFALQPGQVSGPIKGEFGLAVAKLQAVTPAKAADIEEVRDQIEKAVKADAAKEKVFDDVQKFDDIHATGTSIPDTARKLGLQVYNLGPMTADGKDARTGQKIESVDQRMLQDIFNLPQGGETDVVDIGNGEYYAIRVEKVVPAAPPPLEEVRAPLTQLVMQQDLIKRLQAKAEELAARVRKGEAMDAVAASAGVSVQHVADLNRTNAAQRTDLGQELLGKMFEGKLKDVYTAGMRTGIAVARITQVQNAAPADVGRVAEQGRPRLSVQMAQNEYGEIVRNAARQIVKPKIEEALARQAVGVAPEDVPAASGAAASKAKPAKAP